MGYWSTVPTKTYANKSAAETDLGGTLKSASETGFTHAVYQTGTTGTIELDNTNITKQGWMSFLPDNGALKPGVGAFEKLQGFFKVSIDPITREPRQPGMTHDEARQWMLQMHSNPDVRKSNDFEGGTPPKDYHLRHNDDLSLVIRRDITMAEHTTVKRVMSARQ